MKILVIDDQPMVLSGCKSLFVSDSSVSVEGAIDAKTGYQAFLQLQPDVTVIEIKLPDATGFELMRQIRNNTPAAKIIVFSVNTDPAFVLRAIEMGAQGYLSKLEDSRLFVEAVEKVAAGKNYISPHLAEAVIFSFAAVKSHPTRG
jgi:DNA-binding NarL/FixJ family response regulator